MTRAARDERRAGAAATRYDQPAPWAASDTAITIGIYVGFGWAVALLFGVLGLPFGPAAVVLSMVGGDACTLLWIRSVLRSTSSGSWVAELGLRFRVRDVGIGAVVAVVAWLAELAVVAVLVWRFGPSAEESAWSDAGAFYGRSALGGLCRPRRHVGSAGGGARVPGDAPAQPRPPVPRR